MKILHWDTVARMTLRAWEQGATRLSLSKTHWVASGNCTEPVTLDFFGRPDPSDTEPLPGIGQPRTYWLVMEVRCRRCDACKAVKAAQWRLRAKAEFDRSYRTWFSTLTLRPETQFLMQTRARLKCSRNGDDFDALSERERFAMIVAELGIEVTLYLKRIRKESGAKLRYLLVAEAHKSGLPHLHLLIHDVQMVGGVKHATLSRQWTLGFSTHKLCDRRTSTYLCKYISKAPMARVRASVRYGNNALRA